MGPVTINIRDILSNLLLDQTVLDQSALILVDFRLSRCPKHASIDFIMVFTDRICSDLGEELDALDYVVNKLNSRSVQRVYEASITVDSSEQGGSATIDFTLSQRVCEASIAVDPSSRVGSATLASFIDELALAQEADLLRVLYAQ
jgi:hypothetical protein